MFGKVNVLIVKLEFNVIIKINKKCKNAETHRSRKNSKRKLKKHLKMILKLTKFNNLWHGVLIYLQEM